MSLRKCFIKAEPGSSAAQDILRRAAAERAAAHVWKLSPRELAAVEYIDKRCGDVSRVDT